MESFRQDLLNYMPAEHRSILKNKQNTYYLRFISTHLTNKNSLEEVFRFDCFPRPKGESTLSLSS